MSPSFFIYSPYNLWSKHAIRQGKREILERRGVNQTQSRVCIQKIFSVFFLRDLRYPSFHFIHLHSIQTIPSPILHHIKCPYKMLFFYICMRMTYSIFIKNLLSFLNHPIIFSHIYRVCIYELLSR